MTPTDKNSWSFKKGDRVKKLFGSKDREYWATVINVGPQAVQVLWDNGELEVVDAWDCQDLEVIPSTHRE